MLELGLESYANDINVSEEALLVAQIDMERAAIDMKEAYRDAEECVKDLNNYFEIMNSLQIHSSQECLDFAADLLGASLEEEINELARKGKRKPMGTQRQRDISGSQETDGTTSDGEPAAASKKEVPPSFAKRIKDTAAKIWNTVKRWVLKACQWIRVHIKLAVRKIKQKWAAFKAKRAEKKQAAAENKSNEAYGAKPHSGASGTSTFLFTNEELIALMKLGSIPVGPALTKSVIKFANRFRKSDMDRTQYRNTVNWENYDEYKEYADKIDKGAQALISIASKVKDGDSEFATAMKLLTSYLVSTVKISMKFEMDYYLGMYGARSTSEGNWAATNFRDMV